MPGAKVLSNVGTEISFQMLQDSVGTFEALFRGLDEQKAALGVEQYSISLTTMEEVFMKIADGAHDDEEDAGGQQDLGDFAAKLKARRDEAAAAGGGGGGAPGSIQGNSSIEVRARLLWQRLHMHVP